MEYWVYSLIGSLVAGVFALIGFLLGLPLLLTGLYSIAVFIPSLAVTVRRLHDTGRSGWWLLLMFIPLIGPIILLVFLLTDSQPGTNKYGPNPKGVSA